MVGKLFEQARQEPVMFQWLIQSLLMALIAYGAVRLSEEDLGVTYTLIASLLSFITRSQVTPVVKQRNEPVPPPAAPAPARQ